MSKEKKKKILSSRGLELIGISFLAILIVGLILLGLGYNELFYSESATVRDIFQIITTIGGEPLVFIILSAIIYIAYDKKLAKNLVYSLIISTYLNEFLKNIFKDPRPPTNIDPSKEYGYVETSYGFPSGHSQSAVSFWGYLGYGFKDKGKPYIVPVVCSIMIFLIAISRLIVGVHDLNDVVGGLLIGIGFLLVFIYFEPVISEKTKDYSASVKIVILVIVSLFLFLLGILLFPDTGFGLITNPPLYTDTGAFGQAGGVILGFGVGYVLENEYVKYQPSNLTIKRKIVNLVVGLIILFVVYFAFEAIKDVFNSVVYRFIRYALISFILAYVAPLIFTKIARK